MLDISKAVASGTCSEDLAKCDPGPLSYSQWTTSANRVLRLLYISNSDPLDSLKYIASFILKSYVPLWFEIKKSKNFTDRPKQVYQAITKSRYLFGELLKVVNTVTERNAFFAHSDNVLLAMLVDERLA